MKELVIGRGKTIQDATNNALVELGLTEAEVEVVVVEQPENGILGIFGKKDAVVEVRPLDLPGERAKTFLTEMIQAMGIQCEVKIEQVDNILNIDLVGDKMGTLIGRRGQTLDSIQYLTSLVVNKNGKNFVRIHLDTENYRSKRQETLKELGAKMARKVEKFGKKMKLEPMSPAERRVIHASLQDHPKVYTFSEGQEPYRYVVLDLK